VTRTNLAAAVAVRGGHVARALAIALFGLLCPIAHANDNSSSSSAPADGCNPGSENESFWQRLSDSYKAHLFPGDAPAPAPTDTAAAAPAAPLGYDPDRVPASPESVPPWPYSTWPMGGTESIGYENIYYGPLMDALWCGKNGKKWKDSRFTIYGWLEPGGNISTSSTHFNKTTGTGGNFPAAYSYEPNTVQLDQAAIYFERTPDEVQKDHFDWGFRVTGLYGTDYKYTFSNGILSYQYTREERLYGFDPVMYYLDFYFPKVFEGMNVRVGRYISVPDIEAQLAPNNATYSHSLLYTYDPYTQNGIVSTTKLNKNWTVQLEVSGGNDIAPFKPHENHLTPAACVIWQTNSGNDELYPCMNGLNDSDWRWNNIQHAVLTWYHKFDDKWHMDTEVWYMWQAHTPNVNNPAGLAVIAAQYPAPQFNIGAPGGAQCSDAGTVYCYSYAWAAVNYINYQYTPHDIFIWRTDFLNDAKGQRTGFKTRYAEFDLGYTHWIGDTIELRPELRYEHAFNADAYDNPTATLGAGKKNQAMLAADAIFHF
jgi:Putative beta-barrel porin-2, OmpL-like. bbp2